MAETRAGDRGLRILVVDDEEKIRITLAMCLEVEGHTVKSCGNMDAALEELARQVFDLIFLDVRLGVHNGLDYLSRIRKEFPWATVVVITAYASISTAVRAMKLGATDYLPKPFNPAQVELVTEKVMERRKLDLKIAALQAALGTLDPESDFPTENPEMQRSLELARQVADSNANVLICGEIGTGRGRLARALHAWSRRALGPFASISCDTTSADELDAELFGLTRVPGQPSLDVPGRLELCDGGSITLEDIASSPPSLQPKLYRLLKDKEYERHNDFKVRRANARMICTSSADPEESVRRRRLRPELLLALDVVRIQIPPLRNRPEDIRLLARRYLAYFGRENHRAIGGFSTEALNALKKYSWPGNNRELRNLVERAVILCDTDEIGLEHFPPNLLTTQNRYAVGDLVPLETIDDLHIQRVLESTGSITGAAEVLGIGVSTMVRWMKRAKAAQQPSDAKPAVPTLAVGAKDEELTG